MFSFIKIFTSIAGSKRVYVLSEKDLASIDGVRSIFDEEGLIHQIERIQKKQGVLKIKRGDEVIKIDLTAQEIAPVII